MTLILNPLTAIQIDKLRAKPPHALLVSGPVGSGKYTIAEVLIESLLGIKAGRLSDYPYFRIVRSDEGKAIGIEQARELEQFLSLKVPGQQQLNRAVIIEDAHLLTIEAQNALLKTLEEPPRATILVLTAAHEQALLPTIRSRVQILSVTPPDKKTILDYFQGQGHGLKLVERAYAISGGLPGLMHALLAQEEHPLIQATERARQLLNQSAYERLLSVDELSRQRELATNIAFILQQMAHISLQTAQGPVAAKWQRVLASSYTATEALAQNGQPKLALTKLMLSL